MTLKVQFRLRIYRDDSIAIGPGKVALLEAISETGSISGAARQLKMSYRRAWLLIDETNRALRSPVISTSAGGTRGGGAVLTEMGEKVIAHYRAIEATATAAAADDIAALRALFVP